MKTIIVAEDDPHVRGMLAIALPGFCPKRDIIFSHDGVSAFDEITQHCEHVGVLVSDTNMPNMGGVDLVKKAKEHCPGIKTILMSGEPEATGHSADFFFQKPVLVRDLAAKIEELMAGQ